MGNIQSKALVDIILENMKQCVESGNFIILNRDNNRYFITEYSVSEAMQQEILLGLTTDDYCESEPSDKIPGSYINIFGRNLELVNSEGSTVLVNMYIKFEIIEKPDITRTVFISFHEVEYPLSFPFRT